jgi:TPR repeat protein
MARIPLLGSVLGGVVAAIAVSGCAALGSVPNGRLPTSAHAAPTAEELAAYPCRYGDLVACRDRCETHHDVGACNALGLILELGDQAQGDAQAAASFYAAACEDAYAPACNNLAWLYALGRGVPKDPPRSLQLFARAYDGYRIACSRGEASGCVEVATMLMEGRAGEQNDALASLYLDAAGAAGARARALLGPYEP